MQISQPSQIITISVQQPEANTSSNKQFVTYLIIGTDKHGEFSIRRRYNDFYNLRQLLVQNWPGLYIPPIASKKINGNKQQKFVQERKRFLHYFCIKISQKSYLFYSKQFQIFIRGQSDIQNAFKQLRQLSTKQLLQIYTFNFQQLSLQMNSAQHLMRNQTDYEQLKKSQKRFQSLRQQFKIISQIKKSYSNQFNHIYHNILPQYEQKFYLTHIGKDKQKLIMNTQQTKKKTDNYYQLANHTPLQDYIQMISYQLRQARALISAVQTRKKVDQKKKKYQKKRKDLKDQLQKLQAGKSTFKSFFTPGNKQKQVQKIQTEILTLEEQIQSLNKLITLMNAVCNKEITEYKLKRGKEYVNTLKDVAKKQIKQLSVYGKVLKVPLQQFK